MKYLSLFSGIGGFELGIKQAYESNIKCKHFSEESESEECSQGRVRATNEHDQMLRSPDRTAPLCIGYSEIDKYAVQLYEKHFNHTNYGDITKINAEELPEFDLLVGGFPCQAFSIAGKRLGFNDIRGTLFFDIARILKAKLPRLFILENVKGLLSHDNGRTFRIIISTLDELGYDLQWQVLNSKNFGVPQNRERVFIIGHLRGTPRPKVFPIQVANGTTIKQLNQPEHSNDRIYGTDGLSPTLNTMQGGGRQPFVSGGLQANAGYMENQSTALTEAMGRGGGHAPIVNAIRRLTPTECERLQGFPDGWTEGVSDTQRYKTLGNAVTVNVIRELAKRLG